MWLQIHQHLGSVPPSMKALRYVNDKYDREAYESANECWFQCCFKRLCWQSWVLNEAEVLEKITCHRVIAECIHAKKACMNLQKQS